MRVGEFYSVIAMIFAKNFNDVLSSEEFEKIKTSKAWIVTNDRESNRLGAKCYADFLENEIMAELRTDYRSLKDRFIARHYFENAKDELEKFYKKIGFEPKLGELDSISNQLLLVATILKNKFDENSQKLLVTFLINFFLPYATALCKELTHEAKSSFYKSMGYFLTDFCESLKETFGIKQK